MSSFIINSSFLMPSATFSLEVTNTPGTAKVLGSNLTGPVFFNGI